MPNRPVKIPHHKTTSSLDFSSPTRRERTDIVMKADKAKPELLLNAQLTATLEDFEKQIRVDISNHVSGDGSTNPLISRIDAYRVLQHLVNQQVLVVLEEAKSHSATAGVIQPNGIRLDVDWIPLTVLDQIAERYK